VLANRLSEDGTRRVLLPEAGETYRPNLYPPDLANADVTGGPEYGTLDHVRVREAPLRPRRPRILNIRIAAASHGASPGLP
jgi:hypothetical protein